MDVPRSTTPHPQTQGALCRRDISPGRRDVARAARHGSLTCASRIFLLAALTVSAWMSWTTVAAATESDRQASSSIEAIDAAKQSGEISKEQETLYKLYLATGSDKLPSEFAPSGDALRCGTRLLMEVRDQLHELSEDARREYDAATSRPTGLDESLDTDHFRIHYATGGENAIAGWPDAAYLEGVADAAETAWQTLHVEQQWDLPPSDGVAGGEDGKIDIYLVDLGSGPLRVHGSRR